MPYPRRDNRPREDVLEKAVSFAAKQSVLTAVRTMIPGFVMEYDPETKRAIVQIIVKQAFADGTTKLPSPLVDVPVIQPSTGQYMIHCPIEENDIVAVCFTQTGLATFKRAWENNEREAEPVLGTAFTDAVAFPWGAYNYEPVETDGLVLQSGDGNAAIIIKRDEIEMRVGRGRAKLTTSYFDTWRA